MLYVDVPTRPEFRALNEVRADACVSIYLRSTPLTQDAAAVRLELAGLFRDAREQLAASGLGRERLSALGEHFEDLDGDEEFWRLQANSLAILATPDVIRTFRLANDLSPTVEVSDRFHLTPLLRAVTFSHSAFVLALSENAARLVEVHPDTPPTPVKVDGLPKSAADAVRKSTLNDRSPTGRIQGLEGQNVRLRQYVRQVDAAIRPILAGRETPLVLAATGRIADLYRSVNSYPGLLPAGIDASPDRMSEAELAASARPALDAAYEAEVAGIRDLYRRRMSDGRATADLGDAARAATYGAVETLLVDIDASVRGVIDERTGAIVMDAAAGPRNYGVVDEIAGRAFSTGARVLAVRRPDLPDVEHLAAILRYPV
jgi:hypothetical protein